MVATIGSPIVNGRGLKKILAGPAGVHLFATTVSSATFGYLIASLGKLLHVLEPSDGSRTAFAALSIGLLCSMYALRELGILRIPLPQFRRQVPRQWFGRFPHRVTALYWGIGLGVGIGTMIASSAFLILLIWVFAFGSPVRALIVMALFGFTRGLPPIIGAWRLNWQKPLEFARRVGALRPLVGHLNGLILATTGSILTYLSIRSFYLA
jgi:zinc transporter ZupT